MRCAVHLNSVSIFSCSCAVPAATDAALAVVDGAFGASAGAATVAVVTFVVIVWHRILLSCGKPHCCMMIFTLVAFIELFILSLHGMRMYVISELR